MSNELLFGKTKWQRSNVHFVKKIKNKVWIQQPLPHGSYPRDAISNVVVGLVGSVSYDVL